MDSYPEVSGFVANLGWNMGYVFLFLAVFNLMRERKKRYFHFLMLWPVLTNLPLLILYMKFGGIFNNIWQVGITTVVMVLCMGEILYYLKNKKYGRRFPHLAVLILIYEILSYGMWTASCFDWKNDFLNPYFYFEILVSMITVFFAWAVGRDYINELYGGVKKNASEIRFQAAIQTISSFVIFALCVGGYFVANRIKNNMETNSGCIESRKIVLPLFLISAVLVLLIFLLLYRLTIFHYKGEKKQSDKSSVSRSKFNLIFTIFFTLILMTFAVIYNTRKYYDVAITGVFEDGKSNIQSTSAHLENYLTIAESTLKVAADTVDMMWRNGESHRYILYYLTDQTDMQSKQFDKNFTGLYAYLDGVYIDGTGWIPPEGYNPVERGWYKKAAASDGNVVILPPYVDAQTGSIVITIAKSISTEDNTRPDLKNIVCLDLLMNHIDDITRSIDVMGKGYGMVINTDGFIISHINNEYTGKNISDIYGPALLKKISEVKEGNFEIELKNEKYTLFISPIMNQWYDVIVVRNEDLFENVHSQIFTNILGAFITFCLISFFYYLGYKNEQAYGRQVEEMNVQIVMALASAIDAKDKYTNGHSSRVALYSRMIACRGGYNEAEQEEIYMMGLLHDVGKIGVPDEVINKTSKLTDAEFELIKKHPVIGNEILESITVRSNLAIGARWHHERFDGRGYPDGLAGDKIPEEARIIAVADAYDAMTSRRSYRGVIPQEKVRLEIKKGSGTQFDPRYAEIMIQIIDEDSNYFMREV